MRLVVVLVVLGMRLAWGEPAGPDPGTKAQADKLFADGRELLGKGDRVGACKLFDQSLAMDPRAVGTMLNVGLCREEGRAIASAVRLYAEARDRARDQDLKEHLDAAERKLVMLAPRVPHLAVVLPPGAPPGTRVLVDDLVLAPDQLRDFAIDPGPHAIVVTAPGRLPYETKLEVAEAEHREVRVPALEGAKTVIVEGSNRRFIGQVGVIGGAGLGAVAIGLGLWSRHLYWQQFPQASMDGQDASDPGHHCFTRDGIEHCDPLGTSKLHTANLVAAFGTGIGITSVLAIGVGAYLWITGPAQLTVDVTADHAAVAATLHF